MSDHTREVHTIHLSVGGNAIPSEEMHPYSVRFTDQTAVLYKDGKRVTKEWKLLVNSDVMEDEHGQNANTA